MLGAHGSNLPSRLECVADVKIRQALDLPEGRQDGVDLTIEGRWVERELPPPVPFPRANRERGQGQLEVCAWVCG